MKLLTAVIKPSMLDRLASTLRRAPIAGITVLSAHGFGREEFESDLELVGYLSERTIVQMVVSDDHADELVQLIQKTVSTKSPGDGVIFVSEVESAIRLSDGGSIGSPSRENG